MTRSLMRSWVLVALLGASWAHAEEKAYVIGLQPTLSESIAANGGRNLEKYLTGAVGRPFKSRVFKSYDDLSVALQKGEIDFAWINPYAFVKVAEKSNILPVAKAMRRGDSYRAVFFVRSDSRIRTLAELKGLKVAWVDHTSTAGFLFPHAMLLKAHLDPIHFFAKESFAGTHRGVCDAVLSGEADVGATFHTGNDAANLRPDGCVESMGISVANQIHGIASSDPIPSEVIAARAGFDMDFALKVGGIFASMGETPAGRDVLKNVFRADSFGLALDSDLDPVRAAAQAVAAADSGDEALLNVLMDEANADKTEPAARRKVPPPLHLTPHRHED
jgi:phosphonate transport system substrate-binding protein